MLCFILWLVVSWSQVAIISLDIMPLYKLGSGGKGRHVEALFSFHGKEICPESFQDTYFSVAWAGSQDHPWKGGLKQWMSGFPASVELAGEKRLQNSYRIISGMSVIHMSSRLIFISFSQAQNSWLGGPFLRVAKKLVKFLALKKGYLGPFLYW